MPLTGGTSNVLKINYNTLSATEILYTVCAEKVVSDSPGLLDFAIGLVNSVLNLPDEQVNYFEEFNLQKNCEINSAHQKILVH